MSQCSHLPLWALYIQALGAPTVIAGIIAGAGVWIAWQQKQIAEKKLHHDAFDRRYERRVAVYEAMRKFLADVFLGDISESEIQTYGLRTLDAQFLFDDELYRYLKLIAWNVTTWKSARSSKEALWSGDQRDEWQRIESEKLSWIIQQGDENTGFAAKFAPFLVDPFLIDKNLKRS